jgi:hypothetical protein
LWISDCGFRIADFGLRIADFGLRISDCRLGIFHRAHLIMICFANLAVDKVVHLREADEIFIDGGQFDQDG